MDKSPLGSANIVLLQFEKEEGIWKMNKIVMGFPVMKYVPKVIYENLAIITAVGIVGKALLLFFWIKSQNAWVLPVRFYEACVSPKFIWRKKNILFSY